jgi:kynurenine formamidase
MKKIIRFETGQAGAAYSVDLSRSIDVSLPVRPGPDTVNCFWAPDADFAPVVAGAFVGSTAQGGVVNFFNVRFNPHGNGTHTECVGHIARERYVLHECLAPFLGLAKVVSVYPQRTETGDRVVLREQLEAVFREGDAEALVLRTLPNDALKRHTRYSGANPPYVHHEAMAYLVDCGVLHFLTDLPSVDREEDNGALLAHRAFWRYPEAVRVGATITELVYVPQEVPDGLYLLDLQTAAFELDAVPSRPILYPLL